MYAKLFQQVVQSSLTENEPIEVRGVFFMLLAIADIGGCVSGTDRAIARIINVPFDVFEMSLGRLMAPDPDSQSQEEEGRRLVRLEEVPGLRVVNYEKYQGIAVDSQRRAYFRVKKREQRARERQEHGEHAPAPSAIGIGIGTNGGAPPLGRTRVANRPGTLQEVIESGKMLGVLEPACRKFWDHYEARAKLDENGSSVWMTGKTGETVVGNWRSLLSTWKTNDEERKAQEKTGGRTPREAQRERATAPDSRPSPLLNP